MISSSSDLPDRAALRRDVGQVHLYVCTHLCIYIYICILYVHVIYIYIYIYVLMYVYTCTYAHIYMCRYTCIHIYISIYLSLSLHIYIYICIHMCVRACICVYTHAHIVCTGPPRTASARTNESSSMFIHRNEVRNTIRLYTLSK